MSEQKSKVRIALDVDEQLAKALAEAARSDGRSHANFVRWSLRERLESETEAHAV